MAAAVQVDVDVVNATAAVVCEPTPLFGCTDDDTVVVVKVSVAVVVVVKVVVAVVVVVVTVTIMVVVVTSTEVVESAIILMVIGLSTTCT